MKTLKFLIPALALGAMVSFTSLQAQSDEARPGRGKGGKAGQRGGMGGGPEMMVNRIDEQVGGLTADQKKKVTDIVTANVAKMRDAAPEDRRTIMQGQRDQIRAVLTAEQQKKFEDAAGAPGQRGGGKAKGTGKGKGKGKGNE